MFLIMLKNEGADKIIVEEVGVFWTDKYFDKPPICFQPSFQTHCARITWMKMIEHKFLLGSHTFAVTKLETTKLIMSLM